MGCDFFGNDLKSTWKKDFFDCEKKCELTNKCTHFTWNFQTNKCWMKEGRVIPHDAVYMESAVCGIRKDLWLKYKKKWTEMPIIG